METYQPTKEELYRGNVEEAVQFILTHSPMLRRKFTPEQARMKLYLESDEKLLKTYEQLKLEVHVGLVARASEPSFSPNPDEVDWDTYKLVDFSS